MEQTQKKVNFAHASPAQRQMLVDFSNKLNRDFTKSLELTLPLLSEELGISGVYACMQKFTQTNSLGTCMAFSSLKLMEQGGATQKELEGVVGKIGTNDTFVEDDLLFVCMLCYTAEVCRKNKVSGAVREAVKLFEQLKGYKPTLPFGWRLD